MQFYTLRICSQFLLVFRRTQFNELIMFGILVRQVNNLNQAKHINLMNLISRVKTDNQKLPIQKVPLSDV